MADKNTPFNRAMGVAVAECTRLNSILNMNRFDDSFWTPAQTLVYIAGKSGKVGSQMKKPDGTSAFADVTGDADMADAMCLFNGNMWVPSALGAPANVIVIAPYDAEVVDHDYGEYYTNGTKIVVEYRYAKVVEGVEWDDLDWVQVDGWDSFEIIGGYVFDNGVPSQGDVVTGEFVVEPSILAIKDVSKAVIPSVSGDNDISICGIDHTVGDFTQKSELIPKHFYIETDVVVPTDGIWVEDEMILSKGIVSIGEGFIEEHFSNATRISFFMSGVQYHLYAVVDTDGDASSYSSSLYLMEPYDGDASYFFGCGFATDSSGGGQPLEDISQCVNGGGSFVIPGLGSIPMASRIPDYQESIYYAGPQTNYFNSWALVWAADMIKSTMFYEKDNISVTLSARSYRVGSAQTNTTYGKFKTVLPILYVVSDQGADLPNQSNDYFNTVIAFSS